MCYDSNCSCLCDNVKDWGPDGWWIREGKAFWLQYLSYLDIPLNVIQSGLSICRCHYREIRRKVSSKVCVLCSCCEDECWHLVGNIKCMHATHYSHLITLLVDAPHPTEWVCSSCFSFVSNDCNLETMIRKCMRSVSPTIVKRGELLQSIISELIENGIVSTKPYVQNFKEFVLGNNLQQNKEMLTFKKYIDRAMNLKGYNSYSEVGKPGKLYYNNTLFHSATLPYMYKMLDKPKPSELLNVYIKEQIDMFPTNCCTFDINK